MGNLMKEIIKYVIRFIAIIIELIKIIITIIIGIVKIIIIAIRYIYDSIKLGIIIAILFIKKHIFEKIINFMSPIGVYISLYLSNRNMDNYKRRYKRLQKHSTQNKQIIKKIKKDKNILKNTLNISHVFYDNIFPDVAVLMSKWLKIFYYKFPRLQLLINGVGEITELYDYMKKKYKKAEENYKKAKNEKNKEILDLEQNKFIDFIHISSLDAIILPKSVFVENPIDKDIKGIYVNSIALKNYNVNKNFHAKDTNNIEGVIVRELCYALSSMLKLFEISEIRGLYEALCHTKQLSIKLCDSVVPSKRDLKKLFPKTYSYVREKEWLKRIEYDKKFVAEALAEYFISESPREVAMKVGFLMEAEYRKQYGDK